MAGECIEVISSLLNNASPADVSTKILRRAASHNLGVLFGTKPIRDQYEKDRQAIERLARQVKCPLIFTVTSGPSATDVGEIFDKQLNPWREGAKPEEAELLKFLQEVWNLEEIDGAIFLIYEELSPSSSILPHYQMAFSQFRDWITRYYNIDTANRGAGKAGAEGIFTVRKKTLSDSLS